MRILYIDIDSLRPSHLGCYGYDHGTSPNTDRLASQGVCFANCYPPDLPCLPSRTSLFSGRLGRHHGAVAHGGTRAEPYGDGPRRGFRPRLARSSWPALLREQGHHTASISSFADRHGAWHIHAGFAEAIDPGLRGHEGAEAVTPLALDWLRLPPTDRAESRSTLPDFATREGPDGPRNCLGAIDDSRDVPCRSGSAHIGDTRCVERCVSLETD